MQIANNKKWKNKLSLFDEHLNFWDMDDFCCWLMYVRNGLIQTLWLLNQLMRQGQIISQISLVHTSPRFHNNSDVSVTVEPPSSVNVMYPKIMCRM